MRMPEQDGRDLLHLGPRAGRTRRIVGKIEDQPPGPGRDGGVEVLGPQLELVVLRAGHGHRRRLRDHGHVGVADPARRRDHHLVSGIAARHQGIEDDLLAAVADQDLIERVIEAVVALELALHRRLQRLRAVLRRVLGVAGQGRPCAASMACGGVGKSGSPDDRLMILTPWARNSRARSVMAAEAEILTFFRRRAGLNIAQAKRAAASAPRRLRSAAIGFANGPALAWTPPPLAWHKLPRWP